MLSPNKQYTLHASRLAPPTFRLFASETNGHGIVASQWRYDSFQELTHNLSRLGVGTGELFAVDMALKHQIEVTIGDNTFTGSELLQTLGNAAE